MKPVFVSMPDGEYVECRCCKEAGMGEDAWLPATNEFWKFQRPGLLWFGKCKACLQEEQRRALAKRRSSPALKDAA